MNSSLPQYISNTQLSQLISAVYSEFTWDTTKFSPIIPRQRWDDIFTQKNSPGHWNDISNQESFLAELEQKFQINEPQDYFQITKTMIQV